MGEKVGKVALVGAGAMAECHVRGYHEAGAEVVAIVDRNPEAGRKFAEKCQLGKIPVVETLEKLQNAAPEAQAVSVITPNKFHRPLVLEALERGLHVFCEKPPALNARRDEGDGGQGEGEEPHAHVQSEQPRPARFAVRQTADPDRPDRHGEFGAGDLDAPHRHSGLRRLVHHEGDRRRPAR